MAAFTNGSLDYFANSFGPDSSVLGSSNLQWRTGLSEDVPLSEVKVDKLLGVKVVADCSGATLQGSRAVSTA
jgi:hypothetical protein